METPLYSLGPLSEIGVTRFVMTRFLLFDRKVTIEKNLLKGVWYIVDEKKGIHSWMKETVDDC